MTRRPNLLFLTQRYAPDLGGLAQSAERTAESLAQLATVDVVCWTKRLPPGQLETLDRGSVHVHRLGLFHNWDLTMQHTQNVLDWLHKETPLDAVWGHYVYPPGFLATLFAERIGVPSIVSARGNDVDQLMFPPGDFARLRWTLERATAITAVSKDLAAKIGVLVGREDSIHVTPNVVDTDTFAPADPKLELRTALGIAADETVLAFSGELRHKKGLPFLLEALHRIRQRRPACLLVIGDVRAREHEHLARFGLDHPEDRKRILVTGHLENPRDVAEHLNLADLFVMPSLWDGMPNAVLEAMACGLCVLGSDAGGIPEIIAHGETGYLVPRTELHRFGEAALEVLEHADRSMVAAAARVFVQSTLTPASEADRLARIWAALNL